MKNIITIVVFLIPVLGFSQFGTWYLETMDYEAVEFNEEIPKIQVNFRYDDPEWDYVIESQVCGYLKSEIMFFLCECYDFEILGPVEYVEQSCENPENTELQNSFFSYFINEDGQEYNKFYYYGFEMLSDGTERMGISEASTGKSLTFLNRDLSTSDLESLSVTLYPNPVKDELFFSEKIKELEVYNLVGKKVISEKETKMLDFSALSKGAYIVKVVLYNGNYKTFKILKD